MFLIASFLAGKAAAAGKQPPDFNREIRPILSEYCFKCHGPDRESREADLRLDRPEDARRVLTGKKGQPAELQRRISSNDPDVMMPPPDSKLALSPAEKQRLLDWLKAGAPYSMHWAFRPVRRVPVPSVKNKSWPRNPIDNFILARLEEEGLSPSPPADAATLIRRLSFDLTGLPPTPTEIDAFLKDRSPKAWENLVDRLLARKSYGERMASAWLDVARYSDSYGYQVDRDRYVWPWRDWVIRAFNRNLPYDDFITWQLAGDLLPGATEEQILATTFNRLHPQKVEGGSVPEEFRVEYVADRTQTVATAFLGLTMECARCHDHKYDPITQAEYYQLSAFFSNIDEAGLYSFFTQAVPTPTLWLMDAPTRRRLADVRHRLREAEEKLQQLAAARREAFEKWLTSRSSSGKRGIIPGRIGRLDFESSPVGGNRRIAGYRGKGVELTGDDEVHLKGVGNFRRFEPFTVSLWMNSPAHFSRAVVYHRSRAWTDAGSRGYELLIEDGRLSAALIHFYPGNALRVRTREKIPLKKWIHVAVTYDGSSRANGLKIFVNGKQAAVEIVRDKLRKKITGGGHDHLSLGARFRDRGFARGRVDEFEVYNRQLTPLEVAQLHDGRSLQQALKTPADKLSTSQKEGLFRYYLATVDEAYRQQRTALQKVREESSRLTDGIPEIMVMREMSPRRRTYLLIRGAYNKRGREVFPATPAVFPPFPQDAPRNRLGLARWLTSPEHPLTARVAVNRFWQLIFGAGLVRTPEDFGSQGAPPTHPALLDWLARDFVEHGWDVKRLLKLMVTSATYRQSSRLTPELLRRDPENRLLARAPAYRLPAEMLRDNALAVSGLLVRKIGGPPVRPYEVEVSFKPVKRQRGEGLYRRSLYTYWKRTAPAPVMMTLDASKRDVCRVRRERTSSPLQALVMLNGPQFVEASRVLAQRLIRQHKGKVQDILNDMFRRLTSRYPTSDELRLLEKLYQTQYADFMKNPQRAAALIKVGDTPADPHLAPPQLAAFTVVANTLLNYDESARKR